MVPLLHRDMQQRSAPPMCRFSEQCLHLSARWLSITEVLGSIFLTLKHNSLSNIDLSGHTGQWFAQFDMYVDRYALGINLRVHLS